jgi:outer membrane protein W
MTSRHAVTAALVVISAAALTAVAQEPWHARLSATWTDTDLAHSGPDEDGTSARLEGGDSLGLSLGLEYRVSDRIGLELAVDRSRPEAELRVSAPGLDPISDRARMDLWTVRAGFNLHLVSDGPVDLWLGPTVAWFAPGSLRFRAEVGGEDQALTVDADSCFGWGGTAGADVELGGGWTLGVSYTYLDAEMDFSPEDDPEEVGLDLDPSVLRFGVGVRF